MKTILFSTLLVAMLLLLNCSGDQPVKYGMTDRNIALESSASHDNQDPENPEDIEENDIRTIAYIDIVFNPNGSSSGLYNKIAVGVSIYYEDYQPVPPGIAVHLEVNPDSLAAIDDTVYTSALWGWAFAKLVYPAHYVSEEVQVIATCDSVADTILFNLPICQGELELTANPGRLFVGQPGAYDTATITCQLTNGAGIPQRNAHVLFTALVTGQICGPTSTYTDDRGFCHTQYRISYQNIPGSDSDPNYIETAVRATLFGYPDVEEEIGILCTRP